METSAPPTSAAKAANSPRRFVWIIGAVLAVTLVATACSSSTPETDSSPDGPDTPWPTTAPPADNHLPEIVITAPENLSSHLASYDAGSQSFQAVVDLSATATDADGDLFKIDWYSSLDGYLGSGEHITAPLVTRYDSSQPIVTAKVTDEHGTTGEDSIQLIIWIPSDD